MGKICYFPDVDAFCVKVHHNLWKILHKLFFNCMIAWPFVFQSQNTYYVLFSILIIQL